MNRNTEECDQAYERVDEEINGKQDWSDGVMVKI